MSTHRTEERASAQRARNSRSLAAVAAALALSLSACGSTADGSADSPSASEKVREAKAAAVYTKYADMNEPDRTEALIKAAKKEGVLNVYGPDNVGELADAFGKKYGIKIKFFDGEPEDLLGRIVQEADAGRYVVDTFGGGSTYMLELDKAGMVGDYESDLRDKVPDEAKGEHWTGNRRHPFIVAYNTNKVSPEDIPDDLLDFADPKWKGKISMELSDYEWYLNLVKYYESTGMPRAKIDEAFRKIADNSRIMDGHSGQVELLAAGQFEVALSVFVHHIVHAEKAGAPVSWGGAGKPTVQPIMMRYEGVAVLSHAAHPAAATLFMDYVLGPEGTQMVRDNDQMPAVPDATGDPLEGLKVVMSDTDEYIDHGQEWAKAYDALIRDSAH